MKAAIVTGNGNIQIQTIPDPVPNENQALVKIQACAICNGTDMKLVDGKMGFYNGYPAVLGHESVGEVVAVGSKVTRWRVGDIVLRPGAIPEDMGSCWGGFAEYGLLGGTFTEPAQQVIPAYIDPVDATMLITYKETLSFLQNFGVAAGKSVLIWGTGPVSLCFMFFAKMLGASTVVCCGRRDEALENALKMGADQVINITKQSPQGRFDKIIDGVGDAGIVKQSLPLLTQTGEIGVYGIAPSDMPQPVEADRVRILGANEENTHDQILDLVNANKVNLREMVDAILPLSDINDGMRLIRDKKARKVVIKF